MIQTIIVDDELHCLETLAWELEENCPDVKILAQCSSPTQAIQTIKAHKPDLVFLDIEMPLMNGFDILEKLPELEFEVIFTTAYDEFALKAIKVNALDYLLKPIDSDELIKAIDKVRIQKEAYSTQELLEKLFETLRARYPKFNSIALPTMEGLEFVNINEIIHCESFSNYTKLYTLNGDSLLISKTLKEVEKQIKGHEFFRVHHSHLVNLMYIKRYVKGKNGYLIMKNNVQIPVARSKKEEFLKLF
ncbi:MAG: LytTR family DNA-binding domain-containing protein [Bacteroidota bacterium]